MAKILPLKAWRYNSGLNQNIQTLTSPLFDVVSEKHLNHLYRKKYNSVHISIPGEMEPLSSAKITLENWKKEGIIEQDPLPAIYVYYQYYNLTGSTKQFCRKGFLCNIKIHDWDEQVIFRHENTIPHAVENRVELLKATELNVSPTLGLYSDEDDRLEEYMDESMLHPIYDTEDYQGVRDVLSVIHDARIIKKFIEVMKDKQVILADGHHRYEGSLIYQKQQKSLNPLHTGEEGYNYHLMCLTNSDSQDFRILPTHRLISEVEDFSEFKILKKLEMDFTISHCDNFYDLGAVLLGKSKAFGLLFKENAYVAQLKDNLSHTNPWPFPDKIKNLDITVLHYFIIERALGIMGKDQRASKNIAYDRSLTDCSAKVFQGEAQLAIIANEITMDQVKDVCYSGYTMPQKTTYFYPKVICGFVFSSIKQDEFTLPFDFSL